MATGNDDRVTELLWELVKWAMKKRKERDCEQEHGGRSDRAVDVRMPGPEYVESLAGDMECMAAGGQ